MILGLSIPLGKMEELEQKYGIDIHVDIYDRDDYEFSLINFYGEKIFLGKTIEDVEWELMDRYGY